MARSELPGRGGLGNLVIRFVGGYYARVRRLGIDIYWGLGWGCWLVGWLVGLGKWGIRGCNVDLGAFQAVGWVPWK